jgi:hypothetical protein
VCVWIQLLIDPIIGVIVNLMVEVLYIGEFAPEDNSVYVRI